MSARDADAYCVKIGKGWRLPVKAELEALLVDPEATDTEFRADAPVIPSRGYLWSGEDVSASRKGQRWIMNVANGHIFHGDGYKGYAQCVRGDKPVSPDVQLGKPFATIGAADAKLAIVVAMQPDYPWSMVRPTLDKLVATRKVRFELHLFLTDRDRYQATAMALCAAGLAGKYLEMEKKLDTRKLEVAALRQTVIGFGVAPAVYDAGVNTCGSMLDNDKKAFAKQEIEGVPMFVIGTKTIFGAEPIEKFEAAIDDVKR
jgi:hypothetical protein